MYYVLGTNFVYEPNHVKCEVFILGEYTTIDDAYSSTEKNNHSKSYTSVTYRLADNRLQAMDLWLLNRAGVNLGLRGKLVEELLAANEAVNRDVPELTSVILRGLEA